MSSKRSIAITVTSELEGQLPSDPADRQRVLELGMKQWRVQHALEAYRRGEGSLAYAAQQAGVSLREMIPLAYAFGLSPKIDPRLGSTPLTSDQAEAL